MTTEFQKPAVGKKAPIALIVALIVAVGAVGGYVAFAGTPDKDAVAASAVAPAAGDKKAEKSDADKAEAKADSAKPDDAKTEEAAADAGPAGLKIKDPNSNPVVATVNGEDIKRSDVFALISTLPEQYRQAPLDQLFPAALEQVINNRVVTNQSKDVNLAEDEEVTKMMTEAKEQIIRNVYIDRQIDAQVTQKALLKKYEEVLNKIGDIQEVKARHILADSEDKAKEAIKKLNDGADFAAMVKEYSIPQAAQNDGELGYFAKNEMVPEFAEAAFALDKGQYTKDPVKTQFGWHVIQVEDKRKRPEPEFEALKPQLEAQLRQEIAVDLLKKWQKDAKVKKFDINGDPVKETKSN